MRRVITGGSLSGVVAFVGPLALYVASLGPGVAFWDSGEMQTVTLLPGIAHPTGFPFFVVAGWFFAHALPFGSPAWRVSLFCACAAAGAAWGLARTMRAFGCGHVVAVATAFAFAAGDVVWTRGARTDVHDVALFLTTFAVTRALVAGRARAPREACVAAFAWGCGVATHPVVAFAFPALIVLAWPAFATDARAWSARAAALALVPLVCYAYVPARAWDVERRGLDPVAALGIAGGAFWDYASPSSPERFVRYATGASFAPGAAALAWTTRDGPARALALGRRTLSREYGVFALALVITGALWLVRHDRRVASAFALLAVAGIAFAANYGPESDPFRYALPALWVLGACAGLGARAVADALAPDRAALAAPLACALLAASLWPSALFAWRDVRRTRAADDASGFARAVAARTPDRALVIATWTYSAPLAYDAYVARDFGRRTIVNGWPYEFATRYAGWRERFAGVYFVLATRYDVKPYGERIYANDRWQLAKLRP